jgi:hypothetical protein
MRDDEYTDDQRDVPAGGTSAGASFAAEAERMRAEQVSDPDAVDPVTLDADGNSAAQPWDTTLPRIAAGMPSRGPGAASAAAFDLWNYRSDVQRDATDLHGFHVEASDGRIGKVASRSEARDSGYLSVDTGPWIFGRSVVIPVGAVNHIDYLDRVVYLDRTKEQIKASPELDADSLADPEARERLHGYYQGTYEAADSNR